jgi:hypothetical protein
MNHLRVALIIFTAHRRPMFERRGPKTEVLHLWGHPQFSTGTSLMALVFGLQNQPRSQQGRSTDLNPNGS